MLVVEALARVGQLGLLPGKPANVESLYQQTLLLCASGNGLLRGVCIPAERADTFSSPTASCERQPRSPSLCAMMVEGTKTSRPVTRSIVQAHVKVLTDQGEKHTGKINAT